MATARLNPGLVELLGRAWQLEQPVAGLAIGPQAVAFVLADGALAIGPLADPEPPGRRLRISAEDGRATLRPRTRQPPPLARIALPDNVPVATLAALGAGFVLGDASGRLHCLAADGGLAALAELAAAPIAALAVDAGTGRLAAAAGGEIRMLDGAGATQAAATAGAAATCLAFAPASGRLAIGHGAGVSLWSATPDAPAPTALPIAGELLALAWSHDEAWLACGLAGGALGLWRAADGATRRIGSYPAPVRCVAWSADGASLATSGAFRLIAWPAGALAEASPAHALATGRPGLVLVERVAAAPHRPLLAAGYENGMVVLAAPGQRDELLLAPAGQGAITALAWSADGSHLAFGTAAGLAAILALPSQIFK
jgi:hypothetical protein